jgi:hypothetical protein
VSVRLAPARPRPHLTLPAQRLNMQLNLTWIEALLSPGTPSIRNLITTGPWTEGCGTVRGGGEREASGEDIWD